MTERDAITKAMMQGVKWYASSTETLVDGIMQSLASAGYVIVKREADKHQIDAAYTQCGMDGPDLELMYRIMVQAAQEQNP